MDEIRILSPTAILGYGYPRALMAAAMARKPHAIAVDGGSTDGGPYYLGYEPEVCGPRDGAFRAFVGRDLPPLLCAARAADIPLLIGSAGFAGADLHVAGTVAVALESARENALSFTLGTISAQIEKRYVIDRLRAGLIEPLGPVPPLTESDVNASVRLVAQMGVEPFIEALDRGADVVIAGRANDPSIFAALPWRAGFDRGLCLHMAKILECGAVAAEPGSGSDMLLGTITADAFTVEPINPNRRCTVQSVAAHSLYEKSDPTRLYGPGGYVDLTETRFEQVNERTVRVSGSRYVPVERYQIKIEGARRVGFRAVSVAGIRDPAVIANIDALLEQVRRETRVAFPAMEGKDCHLVFHRYGLDGVMGAREPVKNATPHEIGLVTEVVAESQGLAMAIAGHARSFLLHLGFENRASTAGNLAFPFSQRHSSRPGLRL